MKLTTIQKLSRLVYKKRESDLINFITDTIPEHSEIINIGNDRIFIMFIKDTVYVGIAGSDDKQDWRENFQIKTVKDLFYGYKGYALPAQDVVAEVLKFCIKYEISIHECFIILYAHSRGAGIAENVYCQLKNKFHINEEAMYGWGFGDPGGGSRRFKRASGYCNFVNFEIKGDPVAKINFLSRKIGETVKLKKQIKGFFNRIKNLFKGNMNHRSYDCINEIYPFNEMDERGEMIDG